MPNQLNGVVPLHFIGKVLGEHVRTHVVSGTIFSDHLPFGVGLMQEGKIDPVGSADMAKSRALTGLDDPDRCFILP